MIENYFAIVLLAFLIIGAMYGVFTINLRRERDQARRLAESMKKKLDERPVKIVIYSDNFIHDSILKMVEGRYGSGSSIVARIKKKEYLKWAS